MMNECDFVELRLIAHCGTFLGCCLERAFWGCWQALLVRKQRESVSVCESTYVPVLLKIPSQRAVAGSDRS